MNARASLWTSSGHDPIKFNGICFLFLFFKEVYCSRIETYAKYLTEGLLFIYFVGTGH